MKPSEHPTVQRYLRNIAAAPATELPIILEANWIKSIVREAGADDAGIASIDSPELAGYRERIRTLFPSAETCVSVVCRMNPDNVRSPYRQQYELEYHHMYDAVDDVARRAVAKLRSEGVRAIDVCSSYPMNMERWPDEGMWYVAHKPVAIAAGMGRMGIHHLVVHPRFGPSIALASILIDREARPYDIPIDFDPCVDCMLCVTSCPVGALSADRHFNVTACVTHSYRDKYGGFGDWVENVVKSRDVYAYRRTVSNQETVLMWQSMAVGTSFKCTNCMAVCPAGEELVGPYAQNEKAYIEKIVKPLQDRKETVYVIKGSDADAYVRKRFPHKPVKYVHNGLRATSVAAFLDNLHLLFQRRAAKGLNAIYHFTFTGEEEIDGTVAIRDSSLRSQRGHVGNADVRITADSQTWLRFINADRRAWLAFLNGKIRVRGPWRLLQAFARCFPS